jgi:hypothetical protein
MPNIEKFFYVHEIFKGRNDTHDALIPVSRTTGERMISELVDAGVIPPPPRICGRKVLPESSVAKLTDYVQRGAFADLRVNRRAGEAA